MSSESIQAFHYSDQSSAERKKGGGLGRCERSFWKHGQIERFMRRQLPVLMKKGPGCIIDMNAGDGMDTPHPQPDFFAGGSLKTTPTLVISAARLYKVDAILCEANKHRRAGLVSQFGNEAKIIGNHHHLLDESERFARYPWLLVISDPNGHGEQGVDVMQQLSSIAPISDFIVVVNINSLNRCLGLTNPDHPRSSVRMAYQSGVENKWMMDTSQWKSQLNKRQVLSVGPERLSNNMEAMIMLVSNFIPGHGQ